MKTTPLVIICLFCLSTLGLGQSEHPPIESYITESWTFLQRGLKDLPAAAVDPKLGERESYPVYIAATEDLESVRRLLEQTLDQSQRAKIELRVLPEDVIDRPQLDGLANQGLLYLPHPYVVPGGRFNEMYGWDSHFINLGLLAEGRVEQGREMVENHLYQVKHYGRVLNANRSYYLTRSQPPFLATMVADVVAETGDKEWLKAAWPALKSTYAFWTTEPHLTPQTGLSRYYDLGDGPAPEVVADEKDAEGRTHYERIKLDFRQFASLPESEQLSKLGYPLSLYYDADADELTPLFYKGDRSMRESGFDPSDRFGRFNIDVIHYNPVDLNSLLYSYELEMGRLSTILGNKDEAEEWFKKAAVRRELMQRYLWDQRSGLFLDYNFRTQERRNYPFATTYFPLYTGWATPEQASAVYRQTAKFLKPGGIVTSLERSGNQWDYPFGWAPLQLVAALGLERYGYLREAKAIAGAFRGLVEKEYQSSGTIVEKYDVVNRTSRVSEGIEYGYSSNEIGFGWTNAVYTLLGRLSSP